MMREVHGIYDERADGGDDCHKYRTLEAHVVVAVGWESEVHIDGIQNRMGLRECTRYSRTQS